MPDLNRGQLEDIFDMESVENQSIGYIPDENDPDEIIKANIDRANRILDRVEVEMMNGNFSSRLVEAAAKCMEAITNAVSQIQSTSYNIDYLQIKQRMVKLKENELDFKVKSSLNRGDKTPMIGNQNIIITDRESLLRTLQNQRPKEIKANE